MKPIYIYYVNLKNNPIPNNVANELLRLTDNTTVNRVKRYYYDADKIRTILGEVLIKYCLAKNFGIELYRATIYRTRMGKPVYAEGNVNFSISHKEDIVVCAVSKLKVGIDIELIKENPNFGVIKRFFSDEEKSRICACTSREAQARLYYQLWTQKEAAYKIENVVYLNKKSSKSQYEYSEIDVSNSYVCSLCHMKNNDNLLIREVFVNDIINFCKTWKDKQDGCK